MLKTLGVLLSPSGGIKSSEEVKLVKLMNKFSRKLVSKCIYVQILLATPPELMTNFLAEGGWTLLNTWFDDAIKRQNWPLVKEMLNLFKKCPVTAEFLRFDIEEHHAPKLIHQLAQCAEIEAEIRDLAASIYKSWVSIVANSSNGANNSNETTVSLLQSLADEVTESLKKSENGERKSEFKALKSPTVMKPKSTIIDGSIKINKKNLPESHPILKPDKKRSKSGKSDSDSGKAEKKRPRLDRRDEVNPEEKQRIKDMARKLKEEAEAKREKSVTSSMGRIPKLKKVEDNSKKPTTNANKSFEDMLGGLDSKPKTSVKTPMTKNKTAALLEGMKSNSSSKSSSSNSSSSSSSSKSSKKDHHHHDHKHRHHSSSRRDSTSSSSSSSKHKLSSLVIPEKPAKNHETKESPTTPKSGESPKAGNKHNFSESTSFMDAIFSSMGVPTRKKKRKLSESKDDPIVKTPPKLAKTSTTEPQPAKEEPIEDAKKEPSPPAPTATFSFYKDTLETKEESNAIKDDPEDQAPSNDEGSNHAAPSNEDSNSNTEVTKEFYNMQLWCNI